MAIPQEMLEKYGRPYDRRVFQLPNTLSPNVRRGLEQEAAGLEPDGREVVPGIIGWDEFRFRRDNWDEVRACYGVWSKFWQGRDALMFPPDWLDHAEELARRLFGQARRAEGVGCDPAEGGDMTAMAAVDRLGLIDLVSLPTPSSVQTRELLRAFAQRHGVPSHRICIDHGGGGHGVACELRESGMPDVRTVFFGEAVEPIPMRGKRQFAERVAAGEDRVEYVNRRAQLYWEWRELLDIGSDETPLPGWAIPAAYAELRRQIAILPLMYAEEGKRAMLRKRRRTGETAEGKKERTWEEIIGRSPDEADAVGLAIHAMLHLPRKRKAGVA